MSPSWEAFGPLKTPADLVQKLEFDFSRMQEPAQRGYAAFDFFDTAEQIVDWPHPNEPQKRTELRESSVILQAVSHLENGAEHFRVTRRYDRSIGARRNRPRESVRTRQTIQRQRLCVAIESERTGDPLSANPTPR